MMDKCKGIMGKIFGHKFEVRKRAVAANYYGPGVFFMHGCGPLMIKTVTVCKRCRAVLDTDDSNQKQRGGE